jgi:hypothetical protein
MLDVVVDEGSRRSRLSRLEAIENDSDRGLA